MPKTDVEKMEFEDAMKELEGILAKMDSSEISLKESVMLFERGTILKRRCEKILADAQLRINKISNSDPEDIVEFDIGE